MEIRIITQKIKREELMPLTKQYYGDLVKAVIDIDRNVMALNGELHADQEEFLLENGSKQENLWGINIYPQRNDETWIEFDSMINLRPSQGNRSRGVDDPQIREKIIACVHKLVE